MAAANAIASLADLGREGSSSSSSSQSAASSSKSFRDGGAGSGGKGGGTEWGGVAGRGPPVAPRCDYVVDKILGRKIFLVPVSLFFQYFLLKHSTVTIIISHHSRANKYTARERRVHAQLITSRKSDVLVLYVAPVHVNRTVNRTIPFQTLSHTTYNY